MKTYSLQSVLKDAMEFDKMGKILLYHSSMRTVVILQNSVVYSSSIQHGAETSQENSMV